MKGSLAQDTLTSTLPVQWHWDLVGWKETKRPWELRKSHSCLFLVASPARARGGASFVPTHRQEGLVAINDKWGSGGTTSSSTSSGLVPTAVFGGWTG